MKKKHLAYTILATMVFVLLGAGIVSACGWGGFFGFDNVDSDKIAQRQQIMFQNQAEILGITINEVKDAWAEGKTIKEIMEEKGITEEQVEARAKEIRLQEMKTYLQILVEKEVITQAQADKRLEMMQDQFENNRMGKMGRRFKGFGFSRGFGSW